MRLGKSSFIAFLDGGREIPNELFQYMPLPGLHYLFLISYEQAFARPTPASTKVHNWPPLATKVQKSPAEGFPYNRHIARFYTAGKTTLFKLEKLPHHSTNHDWFSCQNPFMAN